ncbi:MAG: FKBP-type peptidyl-prolyl cis-trans isomerase [Cyanobacteria bacterium NC_groundwater_1444_Ag_S-0.65um_54_12]|nr:FKBP-type peptidyl-prolyl cis-trans isomerase [Cyanobacteria bacterium NC_groundwater_1444_Ag_S-0.65um_54_12]
MNTTLAIMLGIAIALTGGGIACAKSKTASEKPTGKVHTLQNGLKYEDLRVGTGPGPKQNQVVKVHYTGWLMNGKKFDSSRDRGQPFEFVIGTGQVIKGWDEGVMTMRVGGRRKLIIPPALGYGARGVDNVIPPNSTLVFDVELLAIN